MNGCEDVEDLGEDEGSEGDGDDSHEGLFEHQ